MNEITGGVKRRRGAARWAPVAAGLGAAAFLLLAGAGAGAQEDFTFEGSGYGHGVGLSQWGALGQAQADPEKSGEDIAAFYYPGSQAASLSELDLPNDHLTGLQNPLWVNLVSEVTILEFTAVGGPLQLCHAGDGSGPCPKPEEPQEGERWQFRRLRRGECAFFTDGEQQGESGDCRASVSWPEADGIAVRHGEGRIKPCLIPASMECEYRYGTLRMRDDPAEVGFHVLLALSLEDYLKGVNEIRWTEPGVNEALVIAARTYAAFRFFQQDVQPRPPDPETDPGIGRSRQDHCWCHLYDNTRDMVYIGYAKEGLSGGEAWQEAVASTAGRVLTYDGEGAERVTKGGVIQAFFSTSSGGLTNSNVYGFFTEWNGRQPRVNQWPYLTSVADPWSVGDDLGNPHARWSKVISASTIARLLGWDEVTDATLVTAPTVRGPATVRFDGRDNDQEVTISVAGAWLDTTLGLKSSVVLAIDGESPDPPPATETPAEDEEPGPDESEQPAPGEDEEPAPDEGEEPAPDEGEEPAPDEGEEPAPGEGEEPAPDEGEEPAPDEGEEPGEGEEETPGEDEPDPEEEEPLPTRFADVPRSEHARAIEEIAAQGVTVGCGDGSLFCPDDPVTRGEMAAFLTRVMNLPRFDSVDGLWRFQDVEPDHTHSESIYAIANAGLTDGCQDGTTYCPDQLVTRAAMADFLTRALELDTEGVEAGHFSDVPDGYPLERQIAAIAFREITLGCGDGSVYCPDQPVTRGQMATFLARAFFWN